MAIASEAQTSIYETVLDNKTLEEQLEKRETLKAKASAAAKAYKEATDVVKGTVETLDIADGPVRVGRFVISKTDVASRSVTFETAPTSRLNIRLLGDE